MTKASDALRSIDCVNAWDVAKLAGQHGLSDVFISYRSAVTGRGYQSAAWQVFRALGKKTDPQGHWRNYGAKTFNVYSTSARAEELAKAQEWASAEFNIPNKWVKVPGVGGGPAWFPAEVGAHIKRLLKARQGILKDAEVE